ncbi:hypothetical protein ACEWY4_013405 [Coilia grayii]|uniref:Interleukin family protein n=1 Tax=Coilia grayii TaxID=363190 RepID=A0ABD1JW97_9TELE
MSKKSTSRCTGKAAFGYRPCGKGSGNFVPLRCRKMEHSLTHAIAMCCPSQGDLVPTSHISYMLRSPEYKKKTLKVKAMTMTMMMTMMKVCVLLLCVCGVSSGRRLRLGNCTVNVHTHELRQHFHTIRQSMVVQDSHMGIKLLKSDIMEDVQPSESCCFLRHLLRFYVERVFGSQAAPQALQRRTTGVLANAFLSIKKQLRQCHDQAHCQCGEQSRVKMEAILTSFDKLEATAAVVKAVGELGSVLEWMDAFNQGKDTPIKATHG